MINNLNDLLKSVHACKDLCGEYEKIDLGMYERGVLCVIKDILSEIRRQRGLSPYCDDEYIELSEIYHKIVRTNKE